MVHETFPATSAAWLGGGLIFGSALAYTGSMVAMKLWSRAQEPWIGVVILLCLGVAVTLEIAILRTERLGIVYVSILATEVVLIALVTTVFLGERFSPREVLGCCLVVAGTALAWT
jgi:small multidrug resistance pump